MYLIFDTETNGKAKNFKAPVQDLDNWPRITQIGWQLYDKNENLISEKGHLIKPDGWTIPTVEELQAQGEKNPNFFVDNNMSTERCEEFGIPLADAINEFLVDLEKSEYMIAHNMQFDINVLGAELLRLNKVPNKQTKKICTMQESTSYCKMLPFRYGTYKWPTLTELHVKLFGEEFKGAHDALDDVKACARSFFELKNKGHILKKQINS
ncbi:MAG: 3'-5' exonuclease [Nanoarchaeota archaeon]